MSISANSAKLPVNKHILGIKVNVLELAVVSGSYRPLGGLDYEPERLKLDSNER